MAGPDQAAQSSSEVLHQRGKLPQIPLKMGIGGVAIAAAIGCFVLFSKKKAEVSALEVAKVTTGVSNADNFHQRK